MSEIDKKKLRFGKYLRSLKDRNGVIMGAEFTPDTQMRIWVSERTNPANINKSDSKLLGELKWKKTIINDWTDQFGDFFVDWFTDAMHMSGASVKGLLEQVGKEKAFSGDFAYWKEMARTHGVITSEKTELAISFSHLTKDLDGLTDEQLADRRNTILAASREVDGPGPSHLAGEVSLRKQGSSDPGVGEV